MNQKRLQLPSWASSVGIFLLKSLGWIAIAILVVYLASYFVKLPPNRTDIFSLVEVLFGIVITALAIVASFAVSYQWNTLEDHIRDFQKEAEETTKRVETDTQISARRLEEIDNNFQTLNKELNNQLEIQRKKLRLRIS